MAKGQKRSNREIRKPKQDQVPTASTNAFGKRVRLTATAATSKGKK